MSDIDKAEELLKRFLDLTDPEAFVNWVERERLRNQTKEYFKKPVVIKDFADRDVEVSLVAGGEVCFEWIGHGQPNAYFFPGDLVRGLREIGVIDG